MLAGCCAVVLLGVAAYQVSELHGLQATHAYQEKALIPAGSCVVTDESSLVIAANRANAAKPGCPDVLDALAQTLVLSGGVSVQGGAATLPRVIHGWQSILSRADYVWLSPYSARRIPWTPALWSWFTVHFRKLPHRHGGLGQVYQRVSSSGTRG